jgi:hypothetical protein
MALFVFNTSMTFYPVLRTFWENIPWVSYHGVCNAATWPPLLSVQ